MRAMYDDIVRQGVPERFVELVREFDVPETPSELGGVNELDGED